MSLLSPCCSSQPHRRIKKVSLSGEATVELETGSKEGEEEKLNEELLDSVFPGLKELAAKGGVCKMPDLSTAEAQAMEYWGASLQKLSSGGFTVTPGGEEEKGKVKPLIQRYLKEPETAKVRACESRATKRILSIGLLLIVSLVAWIRSLIVRILRVL